MKILLHNVDICEIKTSCSLYLHDFCEKIRFIVLSALYSLIFNYSFSVSSAEPDSETKDAEKREGLGEFLKMSSKEVKQKDNYQSNLLVNINLIS